MASHGPRMRKLGCQGVCVRARPYSHWDPSYSAPRSPSTLRFAHGHQGQGRCCINDDSTYPSATPTLGAASFLFTPGLGPGSPYFPQTQTFPPKPPWRSPRLSAAPAHSPTVPFLTDLFLVDPRGKAGHLWGTV